MINSHSLAQSKALKRALLPQQSLRSKPGRECVRDATWAHTPCALNPSPLTYIFKQFSLTSFEYPRAVY